MKYKVINNNSYPVGMEFEDEEKGRREIVIFKNSYILMEKKDILETHSKSKLFSEGTLKVEDEGLLREIY